LAIRSKTRLRTEAELGHRADCFLEICAILDSLQMTYFIQGGVLLGAVREGAFIQWDWDVEFSIFSKESAPLFQNILDELRVKGYTITKKDDSYENLKISFFKGKSPEPTSFTIFGWWHDQGAGAYRRKNLTVPEAYFKSLGSIDFLGRPINCPSDVEAYLEHQYGDWKTPKRTSDKDEYLSESFSGARDAGKQGLGRISREVRQLVRNFKGSIGGRS